MIVYDKPMDLIQPVKLTDPELIETSKNLGEAVQKLAEIEEEKKQVTKEYANKVLAQEFVVNELAVISATGMQDRPVSCQWEFYNPSESEKSLRRLDNMEIIDVRNMTSRDYETIQEISQLKLDFA